MEPPPVLFRRLPLVCPPLCLLVCARPTPPPRANPLKEPRCRHLRSNLSRLELPWPPRRRSCSLRLRGAPCFGFRCHLSPARPLCLRQRPNEHSCSSEFRQIWCQFTWLMQVWGLPAAHVRRAPSMRVNCEQLVAPLPRRQARSGLFRPGLRRVRRLALLHLQRSGGLLLKALPARLRPRRARRGAPVQQLWTNLLPPIPPRFFRLRPPLRSQLLSHRRVPTRVRPTRHVRPRRASSNSSKTTGRRHAAAPSPTGLHPLMIR